MWRWFTLLAWRERAARPGRRVRPFDARWRGDLDTPAVILNSPALLRSRQLRADYGSMREGDNLFCTSIVALKAKTAEYAWHFQQVHHDSTTMQRARLFCFDTVITGNREGDRRGRSDRLGLHPRPPPTKNADPAQIEEKGAGQEPRRRTAATQPIPVGDAIVPQCAEKSRVTTRPDASTPRFGNPRS